MNTYYEEHLQKTASGGVLKNFAIFMTKIASDEVFCDKGVLSG